MVLLSIYRDTFEGDLHMGTLENSDVEFLYYRELITNDNTITNKGILFVETILKMGGSIEATI